VAIFLVREQLADGESARATRQRGSSFVPALPLTVQRSIEFLVDAGEYSEVLECRLVDAQFRQFACSLRSCGGSDASSAGTPRAEIAQPDHARVETRAHDACRA